MKSSLLCLSLAGVFALALVASGATLDLGDLIALGFSAALTSWVVTSYNRRSRPLTVGDRVRPPLPDRPGKGSGGSLRKAA